MPAAWDRLLKVVGNIGLAYVLVAGLWRGGKYVGAYVTVVSFCFRWGRRVEYQVVNRGYVEFIVSGTGIIIVIIVTVAISTIIPAVAIGVSIRFSIIATCCATTTVVAIATVPMATLAVVVISVIS